jgi:UDP-2,3-diacylglucosamine pyrophosphatase LpxH
MSSTKYILSDLHLGAGDALDDFRSDREFSLLLEKASRNRGAELILNGDTFDFVAVRLEKPTYKPLSRMGCTEEESLVKLERILEAHPLFFQSLREFIERGHRVILVPGNHDVDLFWPAVRERLLEVLGFPGPEGFHFESSGTYVSHGLYVEHGHQYYADNAFEDFRHPFIRDKKTGLLHLERCWGNCFVEYFVNHLFGERHSFVNNVRPIPNMILLGLQEEGWWFKLRCFLRLSLFLARVGLPPFKESKTLLERIREGRVDVGEYHRVKPSQLLRPWSKGKPKLSPASEPVEAVEEGEGEGEDSSPNEFCIDFLATRTDTLSAEARRILSEDQEVKVVVFGHDHRYFTNELSPVVGKERGKYYINTGTWIPMLFLTQDHRELGWKDLHNPRLYRRYLTYAVVKRGVRGLTASLKRLEDIPS